MSSWLSRPCRSGICWRSVTSLVPGTATSCMSSMGPGRHPTGPLWPWTIFSGLSFHRQNRTSTASTITVFFVPRPPGVVRSTTRHRHWPFLFSSRARYLPSSRRSSHPSRCSSFLPRTLLRRSDPRAATDVAPPHTGNRYGRRSVERHRFPLCFLTFLDEHPSRRTCSCFLFP